MQEDGVFSVVARSASEDAEAGPGEVIYKIKVRQTGFRVDAASG